jgi:hypothetical protein
MRGDVGREERTITKEIVVKEQNDLAVRCGHAGIQRRGLALVLLLNDKNLTSIAQKTQHLAGSVARTVHDHNQFSVNR